MFTVSSSVPRFLSIAAAMLGALVFGATASGHGPVDPATIDVGNPTGHVHDHGDLTWPPQPRGMKDAVRLGDPAQELQQSEARQRRTQSREKLALARADVRQALGARYTRSAVVEDEDKSGVALPARLVYFSQANNRTVEVSVDERGVRSVKNIRPEDYQPEITDSEIAEAEGLARAHFAALGQDRVAQLRAFGILAYKPTGKGFYGTRVLYISFHRDSDSPPEYVAWVDLTQQQVLRARQEGQ